LFISKNHRPESDFTSNTNANKFNTIIVSYNLSVDGGLQEMPFIKFLKFKMNLPLQMLQHSTSLSYSGGIEVVLGKKLNAAEEKKLLVQREDGFQIIRTFK
jgi:hypothetical protein